mgnify:CR=1 FL=1
MADTRNEHESAGPMHHPDATPEHWRMLVLCFAILMAAAWAGFAYNNYAALMVIVSLLYCFVYFGLPWIMFRIRRKFLARSGMPLKPQMPAAGFNTLTGWVNNRDALIQMLSVPASLAVAMVAIAVVHVLIRP